MSARAISEDNDARVEEKARLAESLRAGGVAGGAVNEAFRAVPRHVFLPRVSAAQAYEDMAIVVKSDADGLPVSASTQPAMMAIMLEQLGLSAGHRVLEIGTGTGYNAALIAKIVGTSGAVVTIDREPDLVDQARSRLAAADFADVTVVCGDGAGGVPQHAPFDRLVVTAGAWDLEPEWLAQLDPGGRIVVLISVRGIQLAAAFEHAVTHWAGGSARRCKFVRMTGLSAGPEAVVPLGPQPGLHALIADGTVPDPAALYAALAVPTADVALASGLRVRGIMELADLDLWLALTEERMSRLNMMGRHERRANHAQRRIASRMPLGGFAQYDPAGQLGVAALAIPSGLAHHDHPLEVAVHGYGPGGAALAGHLAERASVWDGLGRPGAANLKLAVYPAGTQSQPVGSGMIIHRPKGVLAVEWASLRCEEQRGV